MSLRLLLLGIFSTAAATAIQAEEPIVPAANPQSLFVDANPRLHANKQVALHILRDLLQCNYWDQADRWLSDRYIQHAPGVASGRDALIETFDLLSRPRAASCETLNKPIVSVLTSGDIVGVASRIEYDNPRVPGTKYATLWYDQWRIVDGRADEHWDTATIRAPRANSDGDVQSVHSIVTADDPEVLFTDPDPKLHANKQVVMHVLRELLQCNYWDQAATWLSDRYIQHHVGTPSGRDNLIKTFKLDQRPRAESCDKLTKPIVTVLTSGDIVGVVLKGEYENPYKPGTKYSTVYYDQWRIVDGKADEHWDSITMNPPR